MNWGSVLPAYPSFVYLDKKRHKKTKYCNIPKKSDIKMQYFSCILYASYGEKD